MISQKDNTIELAVLINFSLEFTNVDSFKGCIDADNKNLEAIYWLYNLVLLLRVNQ